MGTTPVDLGQQPDPAGEDSSRFDGPGASGNGRAPRRGRAVRRIAAASVLLAGFAAAATALIDSRGAGSRRPGTGLPPGETSATVTRRTLTESSTVDGILGYAGSAELYDRLSGTFTWLPAVGAVVGRGGTLFRVDDRPVVLMYGSVPAYRRLAAGVSDGPDVGELNRNLIALGFDPYGAIADSGGFGEATAAAVRRWQKAEGLTQTGAVELGRVIFAPGARRVTTVHVALGQDPPGASEGQPSGEQPGANGKAPAQAKPKPSGHSPSKHPAAKEPAHESPAAKEPAHESPAAKEPAHESPAAKEGEGGGGAGQLALSTTSTRQIVRVNLKAEQQQLARVGERAPVTLPGGRIVRARVTSVGTVATEAKEGEKGGSGGEGGEAATISVTFALDHRVAKLDQAPVSVALVKSISRNVLTVPATALTATAGGGYAVQALEGGTRVELPVVPGMFADGYVQVEGAGLHQGLTVTESQ